MKILKRCKYLLLIFLLIIFTTYNVSAATITGGDAKNPQVPGVPYYDHTTVTDDMQSPLPAQGTIHYYAEGVMEQVWDYRHNTLKYPNCNECVGFVAMMRDGDRQRKICVKRNGSDQLEGPFYVIDVANDGDKKTLIEVKNWVLDVGYKTAQSWGSLGGPIAGQVVDCPAGFQPYFNGEKVNGQDNLDKVSNNNSSSSSSSNNQGVGSIKVNPNITQEIASVPPRNVSVINGGKPTISCRFGVSTGADFGSDLLSVNTAKNFYQDGINIGWLKLNISKTDDLMNAKDIISEFSDIGTNTILTACDETSSCTLSDPTEFANKTWALSKSLNKPFWISFGGRNSFSNPNTSKETLDAEASFVDKFDSRLSIIMREESPKLDDDAVLTARANINIISGINSITTEDNKKAFIKNYNYFLFESNKNVGVYNKGIYSGISYMASSVDEMKNALSLSDELNMKAFFLKTNLSEVSDKYTDEQALKYQYLFISQFIHNKNLAVLLFENGLTIGPSESRVNEDDAKAAKKRINSTNNNILKYLLVDGKVTEPTSVNKSKPGIYESQLLDMIQTAGCSNRYNMQCVNRTVIRNKSDGSLVYAKSDKNNETPIRRRYDETRLKTLSYDPGKPVEGFMDLATITPIIGTITSKYCDNPTYSFGDPNCQRNIEEVWQDVVVNVEYKTKVLRTAELNVPTVRYLGSYNANGTIDLNFPTYASLIARSNEKSNLSVDFSRVGDGTVSIAVDNGKKMPFPVPLLGNISNIYSYSQRMVNKTASMFSADKKSTYYVDNEEIYSKLFDPKSYDYDNPNKSDSNKIMSVLSSRNLVLNDKQATKGFNQYYSNKLIADDKNFAAVKTNPINYDSKQKVNDTYDDSKSQFDASEVTTGEGSVALLDESNLKINYSELSDLHDGNFGRIYEISTLINGKCQNPLIPKAKHTVTVNGVSSTGKDNGKQLSTIGKNGTYSACFNGPMTIISNSETITESKDKSYGFIIKPTNLGIEVHIFKTYSYKGYNIESVAGGLEVLRRVWEESQLLNTYTKTYDHYKYTVCQNLRVDAQITSYNRVYSVDKEFENDYVDATTVAAASSSTDDSFTNYYCSNPENSSLGGYRRPIIMKDKTLSSTQISSNTIPYFGTAVALLEDISKRQNNINTADERPLDVCGGSKNTNDALCLCRADTQGKENIDIQYKQLGAFLCRNGMLEYNEMVNAGLIFPNNETNPNPNGCLFGNRSDAKITSGGFTFSKDNLYMGVYGWKSFMSTNTDGKINLVKNFIDKNAPSSIDKSKIIGVLNPNLQNTGSATTCPNPVFSMAQIGDMAAKAKANNMIVMLDIQRAGCSQDIIKSRMKDYAGIADNITFDFDLEWVGGRMTVEELNTYADYYYTTIGGKVPFVGLYYFATSFFDPGNTWQSGAYKSLHQNYALINDGMGACGAKTGAMTHMVRNVFGRTFESQWGGMDFQTYGYDSCAPSELISWILSNKGNIIMSQQ